MTPDRVTHAGQVIGNTKKQSKPWIREGTWRRVGERKKIKGKLENAKSNRIKQRLKVEYTEKDREVKRSAREDKRNWMEKPAEDSEKAAENGRSKKLYTITKMLTGERRRQTVGMKDKQGALKTEKKDRMYRWRKHFSEILNREDPTSPVTVEDVAVDAIKYTDIGPWTDSEVRLALKRTRNGKAAGVD